MSPWKILATALVLGLTTIPAAAQTPQIYDEVYDMQSRVAEARTDATPTQREQYEEIEIMARLLDRGIWKVAGAPLHGGSTRSVAFSPDGNTVTAASADGTLSVWDARTGKAINPHANLEAAATQGVYLKGQGIVFTATLPMHFSKIMGGPDKSPAEGLTEWERIRKELHGEKVTAEKPRGHADTSLADAVLQVLAANGKNLTRLPDGESATVVLTLGQTQSCVTCHSAVGGTHGGMSGSMSGGGAGMMPPGGMGGGMNPFGSGAGMPGLGGAPPGSGGGPRGGGGFPGGTGFPGGSSSGPPPAGGGTTGPGGGGSSGGPSEADPNTDRAEFRKYALLGDLAMKQHDYEQAVQAFRKASGVYKKLPAEAAAQLEVIEVATKLARALIAQGKTAEAEKIVQFIIKTSDGLGSATPAKPTDTKAPMPLPGKLIISVPKKLLDQAGSGKVTLDELRKGAVEYLTFDKTAEKPKGGANKP
jgi:hypothetical protein